MANNNQNLGITASGAPLERSIAALWGEARSPSCTDETAKAEAIW